MIPGEKKDIPAQSYLVDAIQWIRERGGVAPCARSVLSMTAGDPTPRVVKKALAEAGAPTGVFGILNRTLYDILKTKGKGFA